MRKHQRILVLLVAVLAIGLLAGCAGTATTAPATTAPGTEAPVTTTAPAKTTTLPAVATTDPDYKTTVGGIQYKTELDNEGDELKIYFYDNGASTGYQWTTTAAPEGVVKLEDKGIIQAGTMPGEAGIHQWEIEPLAAGDVAITFTHTGPGTDAVVAETLVWNITVDANKKITAATLKDGDAPAATATGEYQTTAAGTQYKSEVNDQGKELCIKLSENQTTGYTWKTKLDPEGIVKLQDDEYEVESHASGMVGVGGIHEWDFAPVAAGEAQIVFELVGPGTGAAVSETITYDVTVDSSLKITAAQLQK